MSDEGDKKYENNPNNPDNYYRDREGRPVHCLLPYRGYTSECLLCQNTVIIHCTECGIQVSGCLCTLKKRITEEQNAN